jgi:orotidine-5'-phosphate decarboxylase
MTFIEKLDAISLKNKSLVCVGLDTDPAKLPAVLRSHPDPVPAFNRAIIEATADLVQSYKLNLAFYESLGTRGWDVVAATLEAIPPDVVVIGDGKRGDIGNTSGMYAKALFDELGFDAVTVAPYMGEDSVAPFLKRPDKGVFVLALTSNSGSRDFQYLEVEGDPLYKHVIRAVKRWNSAGNCGIVVGATHPSELTDIRAMVGDMPILVPGLGAQGGDMEQSVRGGVNASGLRAVFNSSRAILYAGSGEDYADKAREATLAFRNDISALAAIT